MILDIKSLQNTHYSYIETLCGILLTQLIHP